MTAALKPAVATGLGIDTVYLPDFREQLADPASGFVRGTFTAAELACSESRPSRDPARHLAARFAAKEAFLKAWDSAFWGRNPPIEVASLRDIEIVSDAWGRPSLAFHGAVAVALGPDVAAHVSLSHDGPNAVAVVVLSFTDRPDTSGTQEVRNP